MTDTEVKKENTTPLQPGATTSTAPKEEKPATTVPASASNPPPAATPPKEPPKREGPWMYVGPTLAGIGIQNRVYTQMPQEALSKAKEIPEINLLFIPVKDYPMANRMLRERTGYLYHAYCKIAERKKGGSQS